MMRFCLCWMLAGAALAAPLALPREPLPKSPAPLWLALHADADMASWLPMLRDTLRTLPVDASLQPGLVTLLPATASSAPEPRVLHPPVAWDTARSWPAHARHRLVRLNLPVPEPAWPGALIASLPLPRRMEGAVDQAHLLLPLAELPSRPPVLQLTWSLSSGPGGHLITASELAGGQLSVPLTELVRQLAPAESDTLTLQVTPEAAPDLGGRWAQPLMATWRLDTTLPAVTRSGREQLLSALDSLLPSPLAVAETLDWAPLWESIRSGHPPAAEHPAEQSQTACPAAISGLLLTATPGPELMAPPSATTPFPREARWQLLQAADAPVRPDRAGRLALAHLPAALARWLDWQRAEPLAPGFLQPRRQGRLPRGHDLLSRQFLPGRAAQPANVQPRPCPDGLCTTDLPDTRLDRGLQAAWMAAGAAPVPLPEGLLRWLPDPDLPAGHLLRLGSEGQLMLLDGATAQPRWQLAPAGWAARRALVERDEPSAMPLLVNDSDLQLWPDGSDGRRPQLALAVLDGSPLLMDLAQPSTPQPRPLSGLPATARIGSAHLFEHPQAPGRPMVLLAAADDSPVPGLWLLEPLVDAVRWQSAAGHAVATNGWRAGWQGLAAGSRLFLGGVDVAGQVWQLALGVTPETAPSLRLLASLGEPGRRFLRAPDLAWLRDRQGSWRQAWAVTDTPLPGGTVRVMSWRDDPVRSTPLAMADLAVWAADAELPPLHDRGWLWQAPAGAEVVEPARWQHRELVINLRQARATVSCDGPSWTQTLVRLPWQRTGLASTGTEVAITLEVVTGEILRAASVSESGQAVLDSPVGPASTPAGWRRQVGQRMLP